VLPGASAPLVTADADARVAGAARGAGFRERSPRTVAVDLPPLRQGSPPPRPRAAAHRRRRPARRPLNRPNPAVAAWGRCKKGWSLPVAEHRGGQSGMPDSQRFAKATGVW